MDSLVKNAHGFDNNTPAATWAAVPDSDAVGITGGPAGGDEPLSVRVGGRFEFSDGGVAVLIVDRCFDIFHGLLTAAYFSRSLVVDRQHGHVLVVAWSCPVGQIFVKADRGAIMQNMKPTKNPGHIVGVYAYEGTGDGLRHLWIKSVIKLDSAPTTQARKEEIGSTIAGMLTADGGRKGVGGYFIEVRADGAGPQALMRRLKPLPPRGSAGSESDDLRQDGHRHHFGLKIACILLSSSRAEMDYGIRRHLDNRTDILVRKVQMTGQQKACASALLSLQWGSKVICCSLFTGPLLSTVFDLVH